LAGALIGDKVDENRDKKATESATTTPSEKVVRGHYETRVVRTESGETYTERVWVEDK